MSWDKLKDHIWFIIYMFHAKIDMMMMLHLEDTTFWPWFDFERLSRVKCLEINYRQNVLSLWNIATWKPLTLICPFNSIKGQMLRGKLKGHIWLTIRISYKLWSYDVPFRRHNPWKVCDIDVTFKYNPGQRSQDQLKDHIGLCICAS